MYAGMIEPAGMVASPNTMGRNNLVGSFKKIQLHIILIV